MTTPIPLPTWGQISLENWGIPLTQRVNDLSAQQTSTQSNVDTTSRTTTSGTYTAVLSPAGICGTIFVAPTSGRVIVAFTADMTLSVANFSFASIEIREGAVVGSGTPVVAATDARALRHDVTQPLTHGRTSPISGLTAGLTYNVQFMQRANGVTLTMSNREVVVFPAP